ncbi:(ZYRO0B14542g) [Zygosaccharomyces parabailii]|nr:(ZYRO0B14542g) [Zygosaccharomyces parabailii]CDH11396.1 uncharacterized protein ZBAI_03182 [Zygosaccharomyces bailii ISA1307]
MSLPTGEPTNKVKIVYDSDEDTSEDVSTTFTICDILRMIAGLGLIWCAISKFFAGRWLYTPFHSSAGNTFGEVPQVPSHWAGQELPLPFTLNQLSKYTGKGDGPLPILLSVKGHVFDVTKGESFYGKWGAYRKFAGTDCSNLLGYSMWDMSALGKKCSHDLTGLNDKEMERVDSWYKYFFKKYPEIGYLVEE